MLAISSGGVGVVVRRTAVRFSSKVAPVESKKTSVPTTEVIKSTTGKNTSAVQSSIAKRKTDTKGKINSGPGTSKNAREIVDYIGRVSGSTFPLVEKIPPKSLRLLTKLPTSVYLIDSSVATKIGDILESQRDRSVIDVNAPSLEFSPGPGLLTSVLLSSVGLPAITVLEEDSKLGSFLHDRFGHHRVQVVRKDFGDLPRIHHMDKVDGGARIQNLLSSVKGHKKLQVFGAIPQLSEVNFLMKTLVSGHVFWAEDDLDPEKFDSVKTQKSIPDVTLWVMLPSGTYSSLTASPHQGKGKYRPNTVLFQLLFDVQELARFDAKGWVPWLKPKDKSDVEPRFMHFVQLSVKKETISAVGGRDHLVGLWYFIRQHLFSRSRPIIPQLEAWIPGCGARLVRPPYQFSIYDTFGSLTPQQILNLYQTFSSWPEFQNSSFLTAVEKFANRVEDDVLREEKGKSGARGGDKV